MLFRFFFIIPICYFSQLQIGDPINGEAVGEALSRRRKISQLSNGNILTLGAPWNDANGSFSGHVRVIENMNDV
jgi:hypothetical protein